MQNHQAFQQSERIVLIDRGENKNGPGWWVEKLCLDVGVERNAAIRIRIPQRQFTPAQRGCNEARQGLVITVDIEWYSIGSRKQYIPVKNDHFNEECQNA